MPIVLLLYVIAYYRLQRHMLTFRFQPKSYLPAYIGAYILFFFQGYSSAWFPDLPLKFVFLLLADLYLFFLYTDSYGKRIFWITISWVMQSLCDLISILILTTCTDFSLRELMASSRFQILGNLLSSIIYILLIEYIIHISKKRNLQVVFQYFQKESALLIATDALFIAMVAGLFYFDSSFLKADTAIYLTLFAIILISIVAFATLYKVARNSKELMDTNLKIQQMEMEQKLAQNLTDIVGNLRSLRHDMNNHLGILQNLLEIGAYEEASDYLRSISEDLKIANQYIFTKNQMLSVLLNTKISHATALRIPIDTDILVNEIPLEDKDLCAIIGNLLDNAIEAAENAEQPSISFSMQREDDCLIIRCENSFFETPVFENGTLITSKENKTLHGIGTQNILSTAKQYGGSAEFSFDTFFHACVTIPYSDF